MRVAGVIKSPIIVRMYTFLSKTFLSSGFKLFVYITSYNAGSISSKVVETLKKYAILLPRSKMERFDNEDFQCIIYKLFIFDTRFKMFYCCVKIFIKDSLLCYFHGLWRCKTLDISKCSMSWVTIFRCVKNRLIPKYMSYFRIGGNSITSASNWVVVIDLKIHYCPHIRINIYQWSHFEIHRLYMIHSGCKSSGNIFLITS